MDNNVLFSAVITTYKRDFSIVKRAIESIVNQTYKNIEIIVVNDYPDKCSNNEKLAQLIKAYQKDQINIKYIVLEKNSGACRARNIGLENASGKYIGFLDDDDEWLPEKVDVMLKGFRTNKNIALIYSNSIIYNEKNNTKSDFHKYSQPSGNVFKELFRHNLIGSASFPIFNKEILIKCGGFNEQMPAMQDLEVYLRICQKNDVLYIYKPLTLYHEYDGERITKNTIKRVKAYEMIFDMYKEFLFNNKSELYDFYRKGVNVYSINGDFIKAYIAHFKALKLKPLMLKKNMKDFIKIFIRIFYKKY